MRFDGNFKFFEPRGDTRNSENTTNTEDILEEDLEEYVGLEPSQDDDIDESTLALCINPQLIGSIYRLR